MVVNTDMRMFKPHRVGNYMILGTLTDDQLRIVNTDFDDEILMRSTRRSKRLK